MGNTGARLILGTVQWGLPYGISNEAGQPSIAEVREFTEWAAAAGVTTLDTARAYGDAEAVIGQVCPAETWEVITKVCDTPSEDPAHAHRTVLDEATRSLGTLNRRSVAGLLVHHLAAQTDVAQAQLDALAQLKASGACAQIGVSARTPDEAWRALATEQVDLIQVAASVLDQRLLRSGFFDHARSRGVEVHVRSVFLQGAVFLSDTALPADLKTLREVLGNLRSQATALGRTLHDVCITAIAQTTQASVVVGCATMRQVRDNLAAWNSRPLGPCELQEVLSAVPDLPDRVVDPSRWSTT